MESYKLLKKAGVQKRQAEGLIKQSLYWGDQPFTAGAIYMGACICFLFIAVVLRKNSEKSERKYV